MRARYKNHAHHYCFLLPSPLLQQGEPGGRPDLPKLRKLYAAMLSKYDAALKLVGARAGQNPPRLLPPP
jgi:hypothetical protein